MSERKVLNKYYPPEFDPSKIPKLKQGKNRTFSIRIMAPFNMRCDTCGEYIYKGKKFNSRKENVDDEDYLGLRIFRFYIKCPRCVAEIAFKTDLANTDYALEAGAQRLFEAEKLAHQMAEKERKEKEDDELNPMKVLENRTKASRNEMEQLDQLEELREMNARHARVDHENMLQQHMAYEEQLLKLQEEEEDKLVQEILRKGSSSGQMVKRIENDESDEEQEHAAKKARQEKFTTTKATDVLADNIPKDEEKKKESWQRSVGSFSAKTSLHNLVKRKKPVKVEEEEIKVKEEVQGVPANLQGKNSQEATTSSDGAKNSNLDVKPSTSRALTLLGAYSDSEESD